MKILMVDDYGYMAGGAENYMFSIAAALRKLGYEVRVLASDKQNGGEADYTFAHVQEQSPLRVFPYVFNASAKQAMRRAIASFKPDVVHIHSFFYHASPAILYGLGDTPAVITLHSDDLISTFGHTKTSACNHPDVGYCRHCIGLPKAVSENIKRRLLARVLPRVASFIAPSAFMQAFYKSRGYDKYNVLHLKNGFNLPKVTISPITERKGIVLIARLAAEKGVNVAVKAMAQVVQTIPDAELTVFGDGPDRGQLEAQAVKSNVQNNIHFAGRIDNDEITKYLQKSEALVIPSVWNENLPTVCIEAMNAGTPIIGSEVGGIPEMVQNETNGLLFPRGDHQALAERIVRLLQDKQLQQKFSDNAVRMADEYRMSYHIPTLVAVYQQASKGKK